MGNAQSNLGKRAQRIDAAREPVAERCAQAVREGQERGPLEAEHFDDEDATQPDGSPLTKKPCSLLTWTVRIP